LHLEDGQFEEGGKAWEKRAHTILKFKGNSQSTRRVERYALGWNFLKYWIKRNNMQVRKLGGEITHRDTLVEMIQKMIFFSNYERMLAEPE
jgi:glutathione peroxidase-family protein